MSPERWKKIKEILARAIELEPEERAGFLAEICGEDAELKKEVEVFLAQEEAEILENNAFAVFDESVGGEFVGQTIDDYEIISQIGIGGMGAVFLAEHRGEGFSQKVALKLIKRGMDTNAVLKRFLTERQILAQLEHPNIARLLDGGSTADGLPYFVMEYIEGESLRDFCENHQFDTNERLELFVKVCNAVSYAHQNLVVHRDIKPSNIIVTKDGTPKLLDFGIGKLLSPDWNDSTAEATKTQMRLMTPEYASPEQLRGQMTTTSTDVYSLGVVLYELLTGTRPFKFDSTNPLEISEKISTQDPVRPSSVVHSSSLAEENQTSELKAQRTKDKGQRTKEKIQNLKGDLDNIILKAIRKETDRRYKSVQELADDIERFLKGLPVSATADSRAYRIQKFVQRHRAGVFSAAAFALLLMTATFLTSWQYFKAQRAQAQAEQRFNDVRKLANSVVFELHDSIQNLPGATPAREILVSRALEYLDNLANEAENDAALQTELADAYDKIGDVQGGYLQFHLGQHEKAKESYQKAYNIRRNLFDNEPNNPLWRHKLATSYYKLGDKFFVELKLPESRDYFQKAVDLYENYDENSLDSRLGFAASLSRLSFLITAMGDAEKGNEISLKAISEGEKLFAEYPSDKKVKMALGRIYQDQGIILNAITEKYDEAVKLFDKSVEIWEKLFLENPQDVAIKFNYAGISYYKATGLYNIADQKNSIEDKRKALKFVIQSGELAEEIIRFDPNNAEFPRMIADVKKTQAKILAETGEADEAVNILQEIVLYQQKELERSPDEEVTLYSLGFAYKYLAEAQKNAAGDNRKSAAQKIKLWRDSRKNFQESLEIFRKFQESGVTETVNPEEVDILEKSIAECDKAIAKLSG